MVLREKTESVTRGGHEWPTLGVARPKNPSVAQRCRREERIGSSWSVSCSKFGEDQSSMHKAKRRAENQWGGIYETIQNRAENTFNFMPNIPNSNHFRDLVAVPSMRNNKMPLTNKEVDIRHLAVGVFEKNPETQKCQEGKGR